MSNNIFFPLRSNLNYFTDQSNQPLLINKIKNALLFYDKLTFESGGYLLFSGDDAISDFNLPPKEADEAITDVPDEPMGSYTMHIKSEGINGKSTTIPMGDHHKSFRINYSPLLKDLGIFEEEFIDNTYFYDLDYVKNKINDYIKQKPKYLDCIEGNSFFKEKVLHNYLLSLIFREKIGSNIFIDSSHDRLINSINDDFVNCAKSSGHTELNTKIEVYEKINALLYFSLPNFAEMNIDDLLDLRKDKSFVNFRKEIDKITKISFVKESQDISIESLFVSDLLKEMEELAPSKKSLCLSASMNFGSCFPIIGYISSGCSMTKDIMEYCKFNESWIAFIMKSIKE